LKQCGFPVTPDRSEHQQPPHPAAAVCHRGGEEHCRMPREGQPHAIDYER